MTAESEADVVVVDTSAIVAILQMEPGADVLTQVMEVAQARLLSSASFVEAGIVLEARFGAADSGMLERFVADAEIDVVALTRAQARAALGGFRRFGKGRHPAALNLGDCYAYGLAIEDEAALLCTGTDFAKTDVPVITPQQLHATLRGSGPLSGSDPRKVD